MPRQPSTLGALLGATLVALIPATYIAVIFGLVLIYSAFLAVRSRRYEKPEDQSDLLASRLHMDGAYPGDISPVAYHVHAVPTGFSLMFVAGAISGLLGIGSGAVKVLAMDQAMRIPFKVSTTTTSNFMIGVTAAARAGVYLNRGYIDPGMAMPVRGN